MKTQIVVILAATGFAVGLAAPAMAHHSFAAEFDSGKPVSLSGTVTKVEWTNPHARIYLDVKDASGKVSSWEFELGSPNTLMHKGWTRNSLKEGDTVSIDGFMAKDGERVANASKVKLADGRRVFAGSSYAEPKSDGKAAPEN